jgi:hypothetical protein
VSLLAALLLTASHSFAAEDSKAQAKRRYYHAKGYIWAIGANARRTIYHSDPRVRWRWQAALRYLEGVKRQAWSVMHPKPTPRVLYVSHEQMWLCIHSKEGPWNANTGNGYYGGLQMTSGWGGVARPDLLSPYQQMQLAETGYAQSGYSLGWIRQQWPNSSYGCV